MCCPPRSFLLACSCQMEQRRRWLPSGSWQERQQMSRDQSRDRPTQFIHNPTLTTSDHETRLTSTSGSVAASKLHHSDTLTRAWFWVPLFDPGVPLCLLPLDRRVVVRGGYPPKLILAAIDDEAAEADAAAAEEVLAHSPSASPPI